MKLEFVKDSEELNKFVSSCRFIEDVEYVNAGVDDGCYFKRIYESTDKKLYSVYCFIKSGIRSKFEFVYYRRNFKSNEPYVVSFVQVKPVEVTTTIYEEV